MSDRFIGPGRRRSRGAWLTLIALVIVLLLSSRFLAETLIDYAWWSELHQLDTWLNLWIYGTAPIAFLVVLFFAGFTLALQAGLRGKGDAPIFGVLSRNAAFRIALAALAVFSLLLANITADSWTIVRYFGGLRLPASAVEFSDPIFHKPLHFYFFSLPFYNLLLRVLLTGTFFALLIYWLAAHADRLIQRSPSFDRPLGFNFEFERLSFREVFDSSFVRGTGALLLIGLAIRFYFNRYDLLFEDHGAYLVGIDWIADHLIIPLQWTLILASIFAALLLLARQGRWAVVLLLLVPVRFVLPPLVNSLYVRPNELALEHPYIQHHINATRSAYGLNNRVQEKTLISSSEIPIDYAKHKPLLDNVRLWDWGAFHDTISQIQPLRPYVYMDTDIDRYTIDGQLRQILIAPRELDIRQIGEARNRWVNPHLIYTHGYGVVMAEANRITPDGLPVLFIKDAPPIVTSRSLKFTQPEIYFSEVTHEPVFVDTSQEEFDYPSATTQTPYRGSGGLPIGSLLMRLAAALNYQDLNIILTEYIGSNSRMMIRRAVPKRLSTLAPFLTWDPDPYLVLDDAGRLVWITDGYMSSDAHPYSRAVDLSSGESVNYMRNSVKATVDAYTGETTFYVFDSSDVLIQAYRRLFPTLFKPASAMPADLRRHARYPEALFSVQAEIYRAFHMRDPGDFYNRADLWDLAKTSRKQGDTGPVSPTYVVATLPGSDKPEFMLLTYFTPSNKDNLIGVMYARCDGEHLGELVFEQLSKQNIIFGPMQVDARINQDQVISKDLSLWNQHGSEVLRGQTLILPIDNSFMYVEPIYIQASQARMPQLKAVALAMGNRLAYAETYEQALALLIKSLSGAGPPTPEAASQSAQGTAPSATTAASPTAPAGGQAQQTLQQVREHLQRYRDLSSQGKWAEAGKELEQIQQLVQK